MLIRSGIFLVVGLVTILCRVRLNNYKNNVLEKLHLKRRDETKDYVYLGIFFFIISIILFVYAVTH